MLARLREAAGERERVRVRAGSLLDRIGRGSFLTAAMAALLVASLV